ncbi:ester cyclase [Streptomyces sp. NPDC096205]|uniref:ester cyclase n=1 Tax=Streptomyces sp. NPDC096205 TaxID=3366081 RepID=UPI00380BB03B
MSAEASLETTPEARKKLIGLLFERIITHGELELADEIFHEDFYWPQFDLRGPDGVRTWVRNFRTAFPDVIDTVQEQYAEGDVVVTRVALTGTQLGPYLGMPPTGRSARWTATGIDRFRGGKVIERTALFDPLALMKQLGHTSITLV